MSKLNELSLPFAKSHTKASHGATLATLYQKGKCQQWNSTELDWTIPNRFGGDLPDDSAFALACFDQSSLGRYGRSQWNAFRWQFHAWMASQFLHGEQAALVASARLVDLVPDRDAQLCLATQVTDEARHTEVFERYLRERVPSAYAVSPSLAALLGDTLGQTRWDMMELGMHILVETMALASFRLANWTFHDELARDICRRVAQDEVRHVSIGVLSLRSYYKDLTASELKEREEFTMHAAHLLQRRFLFEEIWDRMGIDQESGIAFAKSSPLMVQYRQTVCAKLISSLVNIGIMTDRLRARFIELNLLGASRHRPRT